MPEFSVDRSSVIATAVVSTAIMTIIVPATVAAAVSAVMASIIVTVVSQFAANQIARIGIEYQVHPRVVRLTTACTITVAIRVGTGAATDDDPRVPAAVGGIDSQPMVACCNSPGAALCDMATVAMVPSAVMAVMAVVTIVKMVLVMAVAIVTAIWTVRASHVIWRA